MPQRTYEYVVQGGGSFPADMLRRDRCWPADAVSVDHMFMGPEDYKDGRQRHAVLHSSKAPSKERWNSFGWPVIEEKVL